MKRGGLQHLAERVGLEGAWTDYRGQDHAVDEEALTALLTALGWDAANAGEIRTSIERFDHEQPIIPALLTATAGEAVRLPSTWTRVALRLEAGDEIIDTTLKTADDGGVWMTAPRAPGYHHLYGYGGETILAVAPRRALTVADIITDGRPWATAVQVYGLNEGGAFGDFVDLARFAERVGAMGADAVAISPTHALFLAEPERYAPYGPSTRLFLNPLYARTGALRAPSEAALIDWAAASLAAVTALRKDHAAFQASGADRRAFETFVHAGGAALLDHARFEALDAHWRPRGFTHWRDWPEGCDDSASAWVQGLTARDPEVAFQLFAQWRADADLAAAQQAARSAGMRIGLISDLAVGMDGSGSHAWSRPKDILNGVTIGAPPDLLAPQGQDWGLTTFSPWALSRDGFAPFLSTLRAALKHAGGVRIDHAIGLQRLWISPEGQSAVHGAYLRYPFRDLLRLIALESHRHGAIIIGEDLGTVPAGFREISLEAGVAGMRVLWFERDEAGAFIPPGSWDRTAVALTTTHDLPTVAGWWGARDIEWRDRLDLEPDPAQARLARETDRADLWRALQASNAAAGAQPGPDQTGVVADAVVSHIGLAHSDLALVPIEDLIGLEEQPNVPGTIEAHPNWRRRLPLGNGLDAPETQTRIKSLVAARAQSR